MILAAGRGERMRPLSDATPKPLLAAGGKPLIVWQIEALARAGFRDIVDQRRASRASSSIAALGDGARVRRRRSAGRVEPEPLEVGGRHRHGAAAAAAGPVLIVSGDVYTTFDYASLGRARDAMARDAATPRAHLVLVPESAVPSRRRFRARDGIARTRRRTDRSPTQHRRSTTPRCSANFRAERSSNCCRSLATGSPTAGSPASCFDGTLGQRRHARPTSRELDAHASARTTRRRPHASNVRHMTHRRTPTIRCSISAGLPRFDAIRARARRAGRRPAARRRARGGRTRRDATRVPPTWDNVAEPLADALDRLDRAWGAVAPSQRGRRARRELRDAYHANLPKVTAFFTDLAQDLRLFARYRALAASPSFATLDAAQAQARRQRAARFPAGRRRACRRRRRRGSRRSRRSSPNCSREVRRQPARRHQRLGALRRPIAASSRAFPTDVLADGARRGAGRRQGGLEAHAAHALLPAGDAVRATIARSARRCTGPTRRARPISAPTPRGTTRRLIERILALRHEAAQLLGYPNFAALSLVPKMARAPTRCSRSCAISRAARSPSPSATYAELAAFARGRARPRGARAVGSRLRVGEAARRSVTRSPSRRCGSTFRRTRCSRDCSASTETLYGVSIRAERGADVASGRALLRRRRCARRARRPVLPRPLRARRQAGRRVDGRRHQPPPRRRAACSIRSPTSRATCRRPSRAASPRRSRTTTSSRCSTSSATACISC